ncbi:hypothetical protein [Azospirillum argentinense]
MANLLSFQMEERYSSETKVELTRLLNDASAIAALAKPEAAAAASPFIQTISPAAEKAMADAMLKRSNHDPAVSFDLGTGRNNVAKAYLPLLVTKDGKDIGWLGDVIFTVYARATLLPSAAIAANGMPTFPPTVTSYPERTVGTRTWPGVMTAYAARLDALGANPTPEALNSVCVMTDGELTSLRLTPIDAAISHHQALKAHNGRRVASGEPNRYNALKSYTQLPCLAAYETWLAATAPDRRHDFPPPGSPFISQAEMNVIFNDISEALRTSYEAGSARLRNSVFRNDVVYIGTVAPIGFSDPQSDGYAPTTNVIRDLLKWQPLTPKVGCYVALSPEMRQTGFNTWVSAISVVKMKDSVKRLGINVGKTATGLLSVSGIEITDLSDNDRDQIRQLPHSSACDSLLAKPRQIRPAV